MANKRSGTRKRTATRKKRTIEDATFGTLTHVVADLWEHPIELRFLDQDRKVPLFVDLPEEGGTPEPNQIAAYRRFSKNPATLVRQTEQAVIKEYARTYPDRHPSRQKVAKAVKLEAITFPYVRPEPTFGFLFQCAWEEEHGLAVVFINGRLAEVGPQDIVL